MAKSGYLDKSLRIFNKKTYTWDSEINTSQSDFITIVKNVDISMFSNMHTPDEYLFEFEDGFNGIFNYETTDNIDSYSYFKNYHYFNDHGCAFCEGFVIAIYVNKEFLLLPFPLHLDINDFFIVQCNNSKEFSVMYAIFDLLENNIKKYILLNFLGEHLIL